MNRLKSFKVILILEHLFPQRGSNVSFALDKLKEKTLYALFVLENTQILANYLLSSE